MKKPTRASIFKWSCMIVIGLLLGGSLRANPATVLAQGTTAKDASLPKNMFNVPKTERGMVVENTAKGIGNPAVTWPSLVNGNFEQGRNVGWSESSTHGYFLVLPSSNLIVPPHGGSYATWLGGANLETATISQSNVNLNTPTTLRLWYWIGSQEAYCGYDYGYVKINGTPIYTWNLCASTNTGGWVMRNLNLAAYTGQTVTLSIQAITDVSINSNLFIDDVSLIPNWVGSVSITSNKQVVAVGRPHVGNEVASYDGFASGSLNAYVPMLFRDAFGGSYDSALYVQNVHTTNTANVTLKYYDSNGMLNCTKADTIAPLASKGYWLPSVTCDSGSLPTGWVGGVKVESDQPMVAVGRPHIGAEVMTYDGFTSGSLSSYIPMLFNGAFGGSYNAAFYVQNVDASNTANVTLKYYDSAGMLNCTKADTIAPLASKGYWVPSATCDSGSLPAGWTGGVVVSSDQPIVAVGRPHVGTQVTTYNGFTAGSVSSYIPMLFKGAFGGSYNAAFYVQNVDETNTANVTIQYYDSAGTLKCTKADTIAPLASKGYWVPAATCDSGSLPAGWSGGVVVTSDQPIVGVGRPHIGTQVTTYNGFTGGSLSGYLPMLFRDAFGGSYNAAFYVQNTENSAASVTVNFYDSNGNLSCIHTDTIPALSTLGFWMPSVTCDP